MDSYFLIARSRKDNSFVVLKLKETWYLGKQKGREDVFTRANDLEAIDLVTTKFSSEQEMAQRMAMNGYIPDSDVDIFVVSKRDKDGKSYIKFEEAIYNPCKDKRIDALRRIAHASLVSNFNEDTCDLNTIYDEVITLSYASSDYLQMLLDGDTNVPLRFAEQLRYVQQYSEIPYELKLKLKAEFGLGSYSIVRNIVESINRIERFGDLSHGDRIESNHKFIEDNLSGRVAIIPELSFQTDSNYIEGQVSMFAVLDDDSKAKVKKAAEAIVEEAKTISADIHIPRNGVSNYDKRKAIYRVLRSVPKNTFYREKGSDEFKVNYSLFTNYPPSEEEARKLNTYLTGKLPKYFAEYISDYKRLSDAQKDGETPYSEIAELQKDVEYSIKKIDNRFKSIKCLNMAYEWCMLLAGVHSRDKAVGEGAKIGSDTDDKEKTYGKK